jgi:uncharacterized OB-fold protein
MTNPTPMKPLPLRTPENAPFLDALREGRIVLPRCGSCAKYRYPVTRHCPSCLSDEYSFSEVSGGGHVYSFIIVHQVYQAAFEADVPYNVAVVELDEGPRFVTNLVGCDNEEIRVGLRVTPEFVAAGDATLLKFKLASA